jgi:uncharacterized LabA/DUF88 family protein
MGILRTYVYIDGFNFYYGQVKGTAYKWLNFETLIKYYLDPTKNSVEKIKYFTAKVKSRPSDPRQSSRQMIYLRALGTLQNFDIIYGHFLSHAVFMHRADGKGKIKVIKTEEKKSDVNIATHLLYGGFKDKYDLAVLISNDSDLSEPLRIITKEMGKKVGILNPQKHIMSKELSKYALFTKQIRKSVLVASQFPDKLVDKNGTIYKPFEWK